MRLKILSTILIVLFISVFSVLYGESDENKKQSFLGEFYEWSARSNYSKPDQIRLDPFNNNVVWFTQPSVHGVARFDFNSKVLVEYKTDKIYRPDGLIIDANGVLWFGEQRGGTIGRFDPETESFDHFRVPYKNANPAIPSIDKKGYIWVSDHINNKILRFNPKTKQFMVINAPTPNSWVVHLLADSKNRIWYSCYESDRIGMIDQDRKTIIEYELPVIDSGPAFLAIDSQDNIWFTEWKSNKIGKFDPEKKIFVEYALLKKPGPSAITITQDDIIYFSTKFLNAIVRFDPKKEGNFHVFPIPTPRSGQKDGIVVDKNGIVWFTEFEKNKFGRLKIYPEKEYQELPGKFSKNRVVKHAVPYRAKKTIKKPALIKKFPVVKMKIKKH